MPGHNEVTSNAALVREQLNRLLAYPLFTNSKRYPVLLAYTVEQALLGNAGELKERTIGGICEVTWNTTSGSQVQLTIKTEDRKTVTVPARMVEGKQDGAGMVTDVVDGVTYLVELRTKNVTFIFDNGTEASK